MSKRDDTLSEQCMVNPSEFDYKKYAKLIRAHEREECAKVAENFLAALQRDRISIAHAIRARGKA